MRKDVFLKAAFFTLIVFSVSFLLGMWFEQSRLEEVKTSLTEIDNLWNDARLLQSYIQNTPNTTNFCDSILNENLKLGDRIYKQGLELEEYEKAGKFTSLLILEKKRYALLDLQFWDNSIRLKKLCNGSYSTIIYFYSQYDKSVEQKLMDRLLWDFKQKCGPKTVYITFPVDLELSSIDVIKGIYNISKTPTVLINEEVVLPGLITMDELEKYVKC